MTLHHSIQHMFLEFLVENKEFYSRKRALRADTTVAKINPDWAAKRLRGNKTFP